MGAARAAIEVQGMKTIETASILGQNFEATAGA
jgi:hypothetical protein